MVVQQWQKSKRESDRGCQRSSDREVEAWQTSCSRVAEKQLKGGRLVASARLGQGASVFTVFLLDFAALSEPMGQFFIYLYTVLE